MPEAIFQLVNYFFNVTVFRIHISQFFVSFVFLAGDFQVPFKDRMYKRKKICIHFIHCKKSHYISFS
jgi:hypothetical protein